MLAVTFAGNLPVNRRILAVTTDIPPDQWRALRRRWERCHTARVGLDLVAFGASLAARRS